jgi:hypothetical protein
MQPRTQRQLLSVACAAALMTSALGVARLNAQQRVLVSGVVRTSTGDSLPGTPVHVTAAGVDTIVRANARGRYEIALPYGLATLRATSIGYRPQSQSVAVNRAAVELDIVLTPAAQQLGGVDVTAKFTGVRGGVGDEATRAPLPGVMITSLRQNLHAETDGDGRFEIGLKTGERTLFQLSRAGYLSRATSLDIADGETKEVVYFLKPGRDLPYLKTALSDLAHRAATTQFNGFIDGHDHLARHHAATLSDAIAESGMLVKYGLQMSDKVCLFVDGQPRYGVPVSSVNMADVDFVEVYASDGSLAMEWGRGACTPNPGVVTTGRRHPASYVSVWMKH